jgi:hypothetical protein
MISGVAKGGSVLGVKTPPRLYLYNVKHNNVYNIGIQSFDRGKIYFVMPY